MTITIEYVCTGNNGRSPMAEAIAVDYVYRNGLEDRVVISSSGSGLHELTRPTEEKGKRTRLAIVKMALDNGIFLESWRQDQARLILEQEMNSDESLLDTSVQYAVNAEAHFRNVALFKVGLLAAGNYHKPTTAKHQGLILPMAENNAQQVRRIYEGFSEQPLVQPINAYVGVEGDVPNPFCQLLPAYLAARDHLQRVVPMTIDKAIRELL